MQHHAMIMHRDCHSTAVEWRKRDVGKQRKHWVSGRREQNPLTVSFLTESALREDRLASGGVGMLKLRVDLIDPIGTTVLRGGAVATQSGSVMAALGVELAADPHAMAANIVQDAVLNLFDGLYEWTCQCVF